MLSRLLVTQIDVKVVQPRTYNQIFSFTCSEYCPAQATEHVYNVTQCPSQMNVVGHVCASHKKARLTPSRLPNCYRLSTSCTCPRVRFKLRLYQSLNNPHAQNCYKLEPCSVTYYSANCSNECL